MISNKQQNIVFFRLNKQKPGLHGLDLCLCGVLQYFFIPKKSHYFIVHITFKSK